MIESSPQDTPPPAFFQILFLSKNENLHFSAKKPIKKAVVELSFGGLETGKVYYFYIRAKTTAGFGPPSKVVRWVGR